MEELQRVVSRSISPTASILQEFHPPCKRRRSLSNSYVVVVTHVVMVAVGVAVQFVIVTVFVPYLVKVVVDTAYVVTVVCAEVVSR